MASIASNEVQVMIIDSYKETKIITIGIRAVDPRIGGEHPFRRQIAEFFFNLQKQKSEASEEKTQQVVNSLSHTDCLKFDGLHPRAWIVKCNKSFRLLGNIPDKEKIIRAAWNFVGRAATWYHDFSSKRIDITWQFFCELLLIRFEQYEEKQVADEFSKLKFTNNYAEYVKKFAVLKSSMQGVFGDSFDEEYYVDSFINGLTYELKSALEVSKPISLDCAVDLVEKHIGIIEANCSVPMYNTRSIEGVDLNGISSTLEQFSTVEKSTSQVLTSCEVAAGKGKGMCSDCANEVNLGCKCKHLIPQSEKNEPSYTQLMIGAKENVIERISPMDEAHFLPTALYYSNSSTIIKVWGFGGCQGHKVLTEAMSIPNFNKEGIGSDWCSSYIPSKPKFSKDNHLYCRSSVTPIEQNECLLFCGCKNNTQDKPEAIPLGNKSALKLGCQGAPYVLCKSDVWQPTIFQEKVTIEKVGMLIFELGTTKETLIQEDGTLLKIRTRGNVKKLSGSENFMAKGTKGLKLPALHATRCSILVICCLLHMPTSLKAVNDVVGMNLLAVQNRKRDDKRLLHFLVRKVKDVLQQNLKLALHYIESSKFLHKESKAEIDPEYSPGSKLNLVLQLLASKYLRDVTVVKFCHQFKSGFERGFLTRERDYLKGLLLNELVSSLRYSGFTIIVPRVVQLVIWLSRPPRAKIRLKLHCFKLTEVCLSKNMQLNLCCPCFYVVLQITKWIYLQFQQSHLTFLASLKLQLHKRGFVILLQELQFAHPCYLICPIKHKEIKKDHILASEFASAHENIRFCLFCFSTVGVSSPDLLSAAKLGEWRFDVGSEELAAQARAEKKMTMSNLIATLLWKTTLVFLEKDLVNQSQVRERKITSNPLLGGRKMRLTMKVFDFDPWGQGSQNRRGIVMRTSERRCGGAEKWKRLLSAGFCRKKRSEVNEVRRSPEELLSWATILIIKK